MPRTGRQPYATTDVLPFGTGIRRLRPPDGLSDAAKAAFLDLVTLSNLALRLRIGPQSRMQKAPRRQVGTISYFERMELEGVPDDTSDDR